MSKTFPRIAELIVGDLIGKVVDECGSSDGAVVQLVVAESWVSSMERSWPEWQRGDMVVAGHGLVTSTAAALWDSEGNEVAAQLSVVFADEQGSNHGGYVNVPPNMLA